MSEKHLLLYLDAPMQSWGYSSRFNRRTTASWPVKSGIVGMLCAAMGIVRDDEAGIARIAALAMKIYTLKNDGRRLMDYHTVGGGYDRKNTWERQCIVHTAEGKLKPEDKQAVLTDREYLLDCKFGVVLSGNEDVVKQCAAALENPKWGVWFGRKCCLPAARICEGIFDSIEAAEVCLHEIAMENRWKTKGWRVVREAEHFDDGTDSLMDVPLNFVTRQYRTRRIADEFEE
jgi:CRISPR system Cascade subunit CasD